MYVECLLLWHLEGGEEQGERLFRWPVALTGDVWVSVG